MQPILIFFKGNLPISNISRSIVKATWFHGIAYFSQRGSLQLVDDKSHIFERINHFFTFFGTVFGNVRNSTEIVWKKLFHIFVSTLNVEK